jgi:hypothetical protein
VLFCSLEPVISHALVSAGRGSLEIRETSQSGLAALRVAAAQGIRAVVARRGEVADLMDRLPRDLLVVGVSVAGWDVVVCRGGAVTHLPNPSPEQLVDILSKEANGLT